MNVERCYTMCVEQFYTSWQVIQLTALVFSGPVSSGEKSSVNLDRVPKAEDEVRGALLCVQDFVRSPHFTERDFLSDSGVGMLTESAAICESITTSMFMSPGVTRG